MDARTEPAANKTATKTARRRPRAAHFTAARPSWVWRLKNGARWTTVWGPLCARCSCASRVGGAQLLTGSSFVCMRRRAASNNRRTLTLAASFAEAAPWRPVASERASRASALTSAHCQWPSGEWRAAALPARPLFISTRHCLPGPLDVRRALLETGRRAFTHRTGALVERAERARLVWPAEWAPSVQRSAPSAQRPVLSAASRGGPFPFGWRRAYPPARLGRPEAPAIRARRRSTRPVCDEAKGAVGRLRRPAK